MGRTKTPYAARIVRHQRLRQTVIGTPERPRLNVFRSARHTYAQVIDDIAGTTLAAASSLETGASEDKKATANAVGEAVAKKATDSGIRRGSL